MELKMKFPQGIEKVFSIIEKPRPHVLIDSRKEMHGWSFYDYQASGRRECSQERLLINPYAGCSLACAMCYTRSMPGYFRTFWDKGIISVFKDFDLKVQRQLSRLQYASCGYLSPVTEPFQPLEAVYHLSEKIISIFTESGLPVEFITKKGSAVPSQVLEQMASQKHHHSFAQFTTFTCSNEILRAISVEADTFDQQIKAISRAKETGLCHVVARVDPVIPFATDLNSDLDYIFEQVSRAGANHVIMSCMDIPSRHGKNIFDCLGKLGIDIEKFRSLYTNDQGIGNDLNADIKFRRELFGRGRDLAVKHGLTFALCMEFEVVGTRFHGLNDDYMTSTACEGLKIPIYRRSKISGFFEPLQNCDGNCLAFAKNAGECKASCNSSRFKEAHSLVLKDYRQLVKLNESMKLL